jgi:ABC-type glycerol-3-phosphate transport system substrate-binding protein
VWVRQAGGSYFDKIVGGTKPTFTTPQVTQAWQFLQGLFTEHGISSPSASLWMKGKIGFNWSDANYHIGPLQRNAKFAWDIARLPKGPVNDTTAVGGSGFQIINGSKHVAESFALIKFMVTDKESAQDFMKSTGRVSAWLPNAREYARLMTGIVDNVELSLEYMLESYVKPRDVNPYYDEVRKSFDPIAAQMVKGEISVAQAQEQAQHAAEVVMGLK